MGIRGPVAVLPSSGIRSPRGCAARRGRAGAGVQGRRGRTQPSRSGLRRRRGLPRLSVRRRPERQPRTGPADRTAATERCRRRSHERRIHLSRGGARTREPHDPSGYARGWRCPRTRSRGRHSHGQRGRAPGRRSRSHVRRVRIARRAPSFGDRPGRRIARARHPGHDRARWRRRPSARPSARPGRPGQLPDQGGVRTERGDAPVPATHADGAERPADSEVDLGILLGQAFDPRDGIVGGISAACASSTLVPRVGSG